jgi:ParB-like chromosome segregation protein Spo0J
MSDPKPKPEVPPQPQKVPELQLHPFCEIVPPCTETEAAELKADIKANGLRLPIKMFESKILDGRSRYNACRELEAEGHPIELRREYFSGTPAEALAYVISMNVKHRHLSASQRALIAARLVTSILPNNKHRGRHGRD